MPTIALISSREQMPEREGARTHSRQDSTLRFARDKEVCRKRHMSRRSRSSAAFCRFSHPHVKVVWTWRVE